MKNVIENIEKNITKERAKISLVCELDELFIRKENMIEWAKEYANTNSANTYAKENYEAQLKEFEIFKDTYEKAVTLISKI